MKVGTRHLFSYLWPLSGQFSPTIDLFLDEGLEAHYDIVVVGGGAIGCSVAFWMMQRINEGFKILVIERDPQVCEIIFNVKQKYFICFH